MTPPAGASNADDVQPQTWPHSWTRGEVPQAPAEVADKIEAKFWSYLWDLTDAQWRTVVAPTVAALRALLDAYVQRRHDMPLRIIVLQRPRFDPSAAAGWRL